MCYEPGRENILYFKQIAEYLINTKYRERGNTTKEESQRIMALAANLVKAEVREKEYKNDFYPDPNEIEALNWSPPLLKQLMKDLTKSDLKQEFLAQCIVKATKRDVICIRGRLRSKYRFQVACIVLIKSWRFHSRR